MGNLGFLFLENVFIFMHNLFGSQYQCILQHCKIQFHATECHRYKINIYIYIIYIYVCIFKYVYGSIRRYQVQSVPWCTVLLSLARCCSAGAIRTWRVRYDTLVTTAVGKGCLWYWEILGNGDHFDRHHLPTILTQNHWQRQLSIPMTWSTYTEHDNSADYFINFL